MIALFTDFGADDIYVAQLKAALLQHAPAGTPIIDLLHSVPNFDARAGAHLLAALQAWLPRGTVFLAVVDPGVGSARDAVVLEADGKWYVGPDNGLLSVIGARASRARTWRIIWRPQRLSASFHGRDLFAPMAGRIAGGTLPAGELEETTQLNVRLGPDGLAEVIYIDHYGNGLTGLTASNVSPSAALQVGAHRLSYGRVFAEVSTGSAFWYEDSVGLVEIAVSHGSARDELGLQIGDPVKVIG